MYRWVGGGGWWLLKRGELRVGWRGDFKWASTSVFEKGWWGRGRRVVKGNRISKEFIYNLVPEKKKQ